MLCDKINGGLNSGCFKRLYMNSSKRHPRVLSRYRPKNMTRNEFGGYLVVPRGRFVRGDRKLGLPVLPNYSICI